MLGMKWPWKPRSELSPEELEDLIRRRVRYPASHRSTLQAEDADQAPRLADPALAPQLAEAGALPLAV